MHNLATAPETPFTATRTPDNPPCPYCGGRHTVGNGYRDTRTLGRRRRLACRHCGKKFSSDQIGASTLREEIDELRHRVAALESRGR